MYRVLLIEDDLKTAKALQQGLREAGFSVDAAHDGKTGLEMGLTRAYDLIITDRMLPECSGVELCRDLRRLRVDTPILMLTALGTTENKLEGFYSGADDYLVKPFDFRELEIRLHALLKRGVHLNGGGRKLSVADLELNLDTKNVTRAGERVELTAREFALLEFLMRNRGRILKKTEIADCVWGEQLESESNIVEVYINYLRKKIDRHHPVKLIHTCIGMGYVMKVAE